MEIQDLGIQDIRPIRARPKEQVFITLSHDWIVCRFGIYTCRKFKALIGLLYDTFILGLDRVGWALLENLKTKKGRGVCYSNRNKPCRQVTMIGPL